MSKGRCDTVLVTGASSGIGRACAVHLADSGFRVVAASRQPADALARDLRAEVSPGSEIQAVVLDVNDEASVGAAVTDILRKTGRLDAIVHCAGFGVGGAIEDTSDAEVRAIFDTNFFGALRVCRAALPAMRERGAGTLVLVSSIGGRMGLPFQGLYSASKFALEGAAESLSLEVRASGVRVVLIEPGDFRTGFTDRRSRASGADDQSAYRQAFERALAVIQSDERGGSTPEPIARLVRRVLGSRRPRLRYTIGPLPQRAAVQLKKVLPGRVFERILALYYRLDARGRGGATRAQGG